MIYFKNKFNSIINFTLGFPKGMYIIFLNIFSKKKINLVKIFSSKFGHFLLNTESFLRTKFSSKKIFIFFTEKKIDNQELLELWKKKIYIVNFNTGFFLSKCVSFLNWSYYDLRDFIFINKKILRYKNFLFSYKTKKPDDFQISKNYFTCSIRSSNYNKHYQLYEPISKYNYQSWRDTNIENFNDAISKFLSVNNSNYKSYLVNKLVKSESILKNNKKFFFFSKAQYKLDKIFDLIINSKFHVSSSTGIDMVALLNNIPTAHLNTTLGVGFHGINFQDKSIICPLNIFSLSEKRILSLSEHVSLLKEIEDKFKVDRLEGELQKKYNVKYTQLKSDEIFNAIKEIHNLSKGKNILSNTDKILQKKFWSIYPKVWWFFKSKLVFNQKTNRVIVSPYFLKKYNSSYLK